MSFAFLHKLVTYLVAALGLYALGLGGELPTPTIVMAWLSYLASWFAEGPRIRAPSYYRGWTFLVVGVFVVEVLRGLLGAPLLALGLEYVAFLQVSRLFNRRAARDHEQIAVLAFLHLIAATILSTEVVFALIFLLFVIATPWMLVLSQLRREVETHYGDPERTEDPAVRRVLASRKIIGPGFLVGTTALTLPIFAMTVAFFLIFPRVGMGFLAVGQNRGQRTTGFGRNVELGGFGNIRDDPTVVLRVIPPALAADPPGRLELRLRGTSFDHYDGRRWTRSSAAAVPMRRLDDYYSLALLPATVGAELRIVLDHLDEPVLFLPPNTVGLTVPPRLRAGMTVGRRLFLSAGLDVRYLDDDALGLTYVAHVLVGPEEHIADGLEPSDRDRYLQLPDLGDRVPLLAQEITAGAAGDRQKIELLLRYLRSGDNFRYSLTLPDTRGRDPLETFLFEARSGHCEYFSTAMAVMLRSLGIPARNVTGFLGGRFNPYGRYYAIRQGDAHSWVEAYVDGGWVTLDPTPAARGNVAAEDGFFSDVRAIFDAMRTRWAQDVVGYDLRRQISALQRLMKWLRSTREVGTREVADPEATAKGSSSSASAKWVWVLTLLPVMVLLGWLAARLWRRRKKSAAVEPGALSAVRLYHELERALSRRGRPRAPPVTPREHSEALLGEGFIGADTVARITDRYELARYGDQPLTDEEAVALRALAKRLGTRPPNRRGRD